MTYHGYYFKLLYSQKKAVYSEHCVSARGSICPVILHLLYSFTEPDPENPEPTTTSECPSPDTSQSPSKSSKVITLTFEVWPLTNPSDFSPAISSISL